MQELSYYSIGHFPLLSISKLVTFLDVSSHKEKDRTGWQVSFGLFVKSTMRSTTKSRKNNTNVPVVPSAPSADYTFNLQLLGFGLQPLRHFPPLFETSRTQEVPSCLNLERSAQPQAKKQAARLKRRDACLASPTKKSATWFAWCSPGLLIPGSE